MLCRLNISLDKAVQKVMEERSKELPLALVRIVFISMRYACLIGIPRVRDLEALIVCFPNELFLLQNLKGFCMGSDGQFIHQKDARELGNQLKLCKEEQHMVCGKFSAVSALAKALEQQLSSTRSMLSDVERRLRANSSQCEILQPC